MHTLRPITFLWADRPVRDREGLDALGESLAKEGMRVPVLALSDGRILDGVRRHRALLEEGAEHVAVELATDFESFMANVSAAKADSGEEWSWPRLAELYKEAVVFGHARLIASRRQALRTRSSVSGNGYREEFSSMLGIRSWKLHDYIDAMNRGQRFAALSPQHATAAKLFCDYISDHGPGGATNVVRELGNTAPDEVVARATAWVTRSQGRTRPTDQRAPKLRARAVRVDKGRPGLPGQVAPEPVQLTDRRISDLVAQLEGLTAGLDSSVLSDVDPVLQARLAKTMAVVRRRIYRLAKTLQEGSSPS